MSLMTLLLGRRLANREAQSHRIGTFEGVPAMGLDGLGSASYGPEAMLTVLTAVGGAGLAAVQPITWCILIVLLVLFLSYWQTIAADPNNGGCYTVARQNLGENAGLLAAVALMVDYMLNVAVGISAGVGALTSAVPELQSSTLPLCLGILVVITIVNLRGTRESGLVLALPTYAFISSLLLLLVVGTWAAWASGGHPVPIVAPSSAKPIEGGLTVWLILRAFSAGCTAMTGVEAVSNGVGAFKEPTVRYAHRTLAVICGVLAVLLLGIAYLAHAYGVLAMDQDEPGYRSVLSQLAEAIWGRGWLYYGTVSSVLAVLCLSANTSFVGFPRLCRTVASDRYLPKAFAVPGRRLVYTVGILFLAGGAGCLLVAFGGITDRLIPLFAVGAFLAFSLSQAGMAVHWRRSRTGRRSRLQLAINGLGAAMTAIALGIILVAKFVEGAWVTILVIPLALLLLKLVRHKYDTLDHQVLAGGQRRVDLRDHAPPIVLLPLERWDRHSHLALQTAMRLSPEVVAVHLTDLDGPSAEAYEAVLREEWQRFVEQPALAAGLSLPKLIVQPSPYRSMLAPMLRHIEALRQKCPARPVLVVLGELAGGPWWETVLHTGRAQRLRRQLLRHGGPNVAVLLVPWQLDHPETERVLAEEEPDRAVPTASKVTV